MKIVVRTPSDITSLCGSTALSSEEVYLTESMVRDFCELSGDRQAIHLSGNDSRAIVPGNLLVALIPRLLHSIFTVQKFSHCYTAKYKNLRFFQLLYVRENIYMQLDIVNTQNRREKTYVEMNVELISAERKILSARIIDVYFQ